MVSAKDEESLIYDVKLSSVGPGSVSGQDMAHEPSSMDLAMKLHYLRGVYYFSSQAAEGLSMKAIKESMFTWLNHLYTTCGRFRRSDSGRPYIKCNDCGARFIEAQCVKTIDEWLEITDFVSLQNNHLVSTHVIGPELAFSPLVFLQITRFKCGGMSVGLSWAHVLGDAFSAAEYINAWGQVMAGQQLSPTLNPAQSHPNNEAFPSPPRPSKDPLSVKRVGPVGDNWITANNSKMEAFSLHLNAKQLTQLQSKLCGQNDSERIPPFETLCAILWQCVAKVRNGPEQKRVTICKNDLNYSKNGLLSNGQLICVVSVDYPIMEADPKELATLIMNRAVDERCQIKEVVEGDQGLSDFILYGANLTFVDWEEANFYGLKFKGENPVYASYTIDGIGEEGVVLVLPGPKDNDKGGSGGRIVTVIVPENQILELKSELKREWSIV